MARILSLTHHLIFAVLHRFFAAENTRHLMRADRALFILASFWSKAHPRLVRALLMISGVISFTTPLMMGAPVAGKIWLDLQLKDPADSTSAVVAWPAQGDVVSEPPNAQVFTVVFETFVASQNPSPVTTATVPPLPQLGQGGEDFIENLKAALSAKGLSFADGFDLSDRASPPKLRFGIQYTGFTASPPPPALPATFELWVRTNLLPSDSPAYVWSIRELAGNPAVQSLMRSQQGDAVSSNGLTIPDNFRVVVLPSDGPWLRSTTAPNTNAEQFTPIFAVAVAVANAAVRQQMLEKPRTAANKDELGSGLRASFSAWRMTGEIAFNDELSAVDDAYGRPATPAWVLRLTDFNPVRQQTVTISDIQLGAQGRQSWNDFAAHQQSEEKVITTLLAQKAALEQKLEALLNEQHPWGVPHFATDAELGGRIDILRRQPGVAAVEAKLFRDQVAYSVTWYPVLTTLEASGTYNSDRGGNISTKLAVQTRDYGLGVEGYIANRRRGLFADVSSTPKLSGMPDNAMITWGLFGDYSRESPVRFGTPKIFSAEEEQARAGLRLRLEGSHTEGTTDVHARRWKFEAIGGYRHARLASDNFHFVQEPNGAAPFASTEFLGEWEHSLKKSPDQNLAPQSALHLELNLDASPSDGTTNHFARSQFKLVDEIRFGTGRLENSLVRLTASGGAATSDTPVAWWFQLGGDERMRGFELGELTGRSFVHAAIETGFSAGAFLNRAKKDMGAKSPAPPFDLRQIRLLAGVERAWIGDPPAFFPPAGTLRGGWSYSLTAEYAGAIPGLPGNSKLALGYGYAPNSSHRSGRVFVALRVPLSIPQPP